MEDNAKQPPTADASLFNGQPTETSSYRTLQKVMQFRLENPEHQRKAIQSVVEIFRGMEINTYDNATVEDIRANYCSLSSNELFANI